MEENARRGVIIGWGVALIMLALAFIIGGPYWGWELFAVGVVVVLHGHFPNLFKSRTAKVIVAVLLLTITVGLVVTSPFGRSFRPPPHSAASTSSAPNSAPLPTTSHAREVPAAAPSTTSASAPVSRSPAPVAVVPPAAVAHPKTGGSPTGNPALPQLSGMGHEFGGATISPSSAPRPKPTQQPETSAPTPAPNVDHGIFNNGPNNGTQHVEDNRQYGRPAPPPKVLDVQVTHVPPQPTTGELQEPHGERIVFRIDHTFFNPMFRVVCDRPCKITSVGWAGAGSIGQKSVADPENANASIVYSAMMTPAPEGQDLYLWVVAQDDSTAAILRVEGYTPPN